MNREESIKLALRAEMYLVTYVTSGGYVGACTMSKRQLDECRLEIVEAVKVLD